MTAQTPQRRESSRSLAASVSALASALAWASVAAAQSGDAPSLSGSVAPPTATGAGTGATGAGPQPPAAGQSYFFLLIGGFLVLWIVMMTMGQRRESRKRQTLLDSLKKHDRVQTTGGMIGTIVEIKPDTIVLKVDENSNTKVTFTKAAIVGVLKESTATTAASGKDGNAESGGKGSSKS